MDKYLSFKTDNFGRTQISLKPVENNLSIYQIHFDDLYNVKHFFENMDSETKCFCATTIANDAFGSVINIAFSPNNKVKPEYKIILTNSEWTKAHIGHIKAELKTQLQQIINSTETQKEDATDLCR